MAKIKAFKWQLSSIDEVQVSMTIAGGAVVDSGLNYHADIRGRWRSAVRIDSSHGAPHIHKFWRPHADATEPFHAGSAQSGDYALILEAAKADLRRNWKRYRALMEATIR